MVWGPPQVNNKAKLHASIADQDLGYLRNKGLHECGNSPELDQENHLPATLWSPTGNKEGICTTWLYNNDQGDIIMQITPSYRWHFFDPKEDENYITYEEFMQNYQPILFRTIPKEVAQEWLIQVEQLAAKIKDNEIKASA
jgi:hypothetical protein